MRRLAVVTVIASVALAIATTALAWLNRETPVPESLYMGSNVDVSAPIGTLVFVATGALIALRQPRHPVGWCFILLGLLGDLMLAFANYGLYGTVTAPGLLPAAGVAVWLSHWFWAMPSGVLPIMVLLFPNGRPPTVRWWPVAWLAVGATLLFAASDALGAYLAAGALESTVGTSIAPEPLGLASLVGAFIWAVTLVAAVASLVVRFRRSRGAERQQLKWFACAAAVVVSFQLVGLAVYVAPIPPVISLLTNLSFALLPLSAAIAILRYRLYDIDVVIERTLVYGAVTVTLGATYVPRSSSSRVCCVRLPGDPRLRSRCRRCSSSRYSTRSAGALKTRSIDVSTGRATTLPELSMRSSFGCVTRSSSTTSARTSSRR